MNYYIHIGFLLNFLHQYLQEIVINALKNLNNQGLLQQ